MATPLTVTEATRDFLDVVNPVPDRRETTVFLKGGRPVARIVPVASAPMTGRMLAEKWAGLPHLDADDAAARAAEIAATRAQTS